MARAPSSKEAEPRSSTLGRKIQKLRKDRKWSQAELAGRLQVHATHVSRLETDRYAPSLELLKKLAEAFEVTTDYLLYDDVEVAGSNGLRDKTLYERMKLLDTLDDQDRTVILGVIDAFLMKRQIWTVISKQGSAGSGA